MAARVPFIKPHLPPPDEIANDLREIYKNNYYSNNGPVYRRFAAAMEAYLGQGLHVVAVNNATTALMLAMKACCPKNSQKKYIAVPAFTFPAGPLAIEWCGYEPVFFDINTSDAQPSLKSFEKLYEKYQSQVAGILLTNSFGIGNDELAKWEKTSEDKDLALVIDSAPGIGSVYPDGRLLGGGGTCEIFSMHVTKPFGIGEGGLITTKDKALAQKLESLKNFGFGPSKMTVGQGLNGKITELDCAIGLRLLKSFDATLEQRKAVHKMYEDCLEGRVRFLPNARKAAIQFITIIVGAEVRDRVLACLEEHKIDARTYYAPPLHQHAYFKDTLKVELPETELLSRQIISLPLHGDMQPQLVERICAIVKEAL
ncbi:MAG TPA: DegT/DnrJ/EryC1/StrS family aminotransferase [Candidatus Saccharimonadales bacterium]